MSLRSRRGADWATNVVERLFQEEGPINELAAEKGATEGVVEELRRRGGLYQ